MASAFLMPKNGKTVFTLQKSIKNICQNFGIFFVQLAISCAISKKGHYILWFAIDKLFF